MIFEYSDKTKSYIERVRAFMDEHIYPNEDRYHHEVETGERWKVLPVIEELKPDRPQGRPVEPVPQHLRA